MVLNNFRYSIANRRDFQWVESPRCNFSGILGGINCNVFGIIKKQN